MEKSLESQDHSLVWLRGRGHASSGNEEPRVSNRGLALKQASARTLEAWRQGKEYRVWSGRVHSQDSEDLMREKGVESSDLTPGTETDRRPPWGSHKPR